MRSRVVIVARKSDHICVVQDVPDTRGSWYQRQQHSTQSNYSMGSQHSSGSIDQPAPPQLASHSTPAALPAPPLPSATAAPSTSAAASASAPTAGSAKASFASLLGKHPAIKEEPTTPGGTLTSETPPPGGSKRSPFRKLSPVPATPGEDMSQIVTLLNELKSDLTRKFSELSKRVDSMDASLGKVSQQVAAGPQPEIGGSSTGRHRSSGSTIIDPAASTKGLTSSQQPPSSSSSRRDSLKIPSADPSTATPASSSSGGDKAKRRERSKSPHGSKHQHHHHHHHHRKATHPTPSATPTVSQTDLTQTAPPSSGWSTDVAGASSSGLVRAADAGTTTATITTPSTKELEPGQRSQKQSASRPAGPSKGSFEQSDDDQDATSKL